MLTQNEYYDLVNDLYDMARTAAYRMDVRLRNISLNGGTMSTVEEDHTLKLETTNYSETVLIPQVWFNKRHYYCFNIELRIEDALKVLKKKELKSGTRP